MLRLTTERWRAVASALAALDCQQAEVVLGIEMVRDLIEAGCSAGGRPYTAEQMVDAADALLQRRP